MRASYKAVAFFLTRGYWCNMSNTRDERERWLVLRLAAESGCDLRTAHKWLRGGRVAAVTDRALRSVAWELDLQPECQERIAAALKRAS